MKSFGDAFLFATMPFEEGGLHSRVSLKGTTPCEVLGQSTDLHGGLRSHDFVISVDWRDI